MDIPKSSATNVGRAVLSERDLAERWLTSRRTLQRWRSGGLGPRFFRVGGTIRYRIEDILKFEEGSHPSGRDEAP